MDHGEDIKTAIAREMKEEVNLTGDFSYRIVHVDGPAELKNAKVLQDLSRLMSLSTII